MADNNPASPAPPPRPVYVPPTTPKPVYSSYAPDPSNKKYQTDKLGRLTPAGRALLDQDEKNAKTRFDADTILYNTEEGRAQKRYEDAAGAWDRSYGKGLEAKGNKATENAAYLSGPEHKWYLENTNTRGLETLAGSTVGNTLLGLVPGMKAAPGTKWWGRALLTAPYAAEMGYSGLNALDQNTDPDDPRSLDIADYNRKLDAGWGAGAFFGGLKNATAYAGMPNKDASAFAPTEDTVKKALAAAKEPPTFNKGDTPTTAMKTLGRYLNVPSTEGTPLKTLTPQVAKAAANATDTEISAIAGAARPAIEGKDRAGVIEWINKIGKPGARRLPIAPIIGPAALAAGAYGLTHDPSTAFGGEPKRDESDLHYYARGLGDLDRAVGAQAAWNTGSGLGTGLAEALKAAARPSSVIPKPERSVPDLENYADPRSPNYDPAKIREEQSKRRGLEQALAEDARQRRNPNPYPAPREEIGAEARNAVPSVTGPGFDRSVGRGRAGTESQPSAFLNAKDYGITPSASPEDRALQTLYKAADDDTSGLARGGEVRKHLHGVSAVQTSLDADLKKASKKVDTLDKAKESEAVKRAREKAHAEREDIIHNVWALHFLAKHANEGHVTLKPGMTRQAIIALARSRYNRETGQPHHRHR